MKKYTPLLLALMIAVSIPAMGQSTDEAENTRIIEERNFIFVAQMANPLRGSAIQLTSYYDLTVSPDTVIAFLPYFGRAFTAPINPREGGIMFTSTNFSYKSNKKARKKRWDITIQPRDNDQATRLSLTVFSNGSASLQVSSNNRQPISFNGYIVAGKSRSKKAF